MQPSLRSSVVHTLHPGKQASKTLSSSVTLQHSQVVIKTPTQRVQVNSGFPTVPAHLAYTPSSPAKDQPKEVAACSYFL